MTRSRAALWHLLPSLLLLFACASVVVVAWYPGPFMQLSRAGELAALLVVAACFIGPAMTWLVATPGKSKPKLVLDLAVIVLIQVSAITWGMLNLSAQKPFFMVFTLDRFEVLARAEVPYRIDNAGFLDKPLVGPLLLYANMPPTATPAYQRLLQEILFQGEPDLQYRPEFWRNYSENQHLALQAARPLAELRAARPDDVAAIDRLVSEHGGDIAGLGFVPARMRDGQFTVVLGSGGAVAGYLRIDPWLH